MDFYDAVEGRRSVRRFERRAVALDVLKKVLTAACRAPSAGNLQPWHLYVLESEPAKQRLIESGASKQFFGDAAAIVVVCADLEAAEAGYGARGRNLYCLQDTAALIQTLLLACRAEGLGTCWVGAFDEEAARRALDLPPDLRPVSLIPLGYPAESPPDRGRKGLEEVAEFL